MKLKTLFSATLLAMVGFKAVSTMGQEADASLLTANSPFVLYLQNPPWIKEMVYVESQYWQAGSTPGHIDRRGWDNITNRAAIQPSGIFREMLTDSSGGPPRTPTERIVLGVSDHYYWSAHKDQYAIPFSSLSLSSRLPEEGASKENLGFINSERAKASIERLRYLGLPPLQTNTFALAGQNQFTAQTADGYALEGNILAATNNRPLALAYTLGGSTNDVFAIRYEYKPGEDLPNYFERRELRNGHLFGFPHTNWIESANYGIDVAVTNGYSPSIFFTNMAIFTHMLMESNGERYVVAENGNGKLVDESPPPQLPMSGDGSGGKAALVALAILLAAGGLLLWRIRKRS